jgi:P-type Cu+ transporter
MDCAECTLHVRKAITSLPGVAGVEVFLAAEKAIIQYDPAQIGLPELTKAVEVAGYSVPQPDTKETASPGKVEKPLHNIGAQFTRQVLVFFGVVFGFVLFIVVAGEWFGLIDAVTEKIPFPVGLAIVAVAGYPVFKNVARAALNKQIIAHTLMTVGVLAALAIGQWATAAVVVFFMRAGDYAEHFTVGSARRAVKDLTAMAPQKARLERDGQEVEVPISYVTPGETVVVRPGEKVPVDGEVVSGQVTLDQAAITGESMPVEAGPGARVFAATIIRMGSLRVRTTAVGSDTTFGKVIKLVEEAEAHRADVQRIADRFSSYYLPFVAGIAALTFLIRRDPLSTAAVLVVACSCSFALATPIAMLASIGAGARRGVIIKGGKYIETLARADILLIDKTGTLTLGQPQITDVIPLQPRVHSRTDLLSMAASVERYSEHPLAEAVRLEAQASELFLEDPLDFEAVPGMGVRARLNGSHVAIGNRRLVGLASNADTEEALNEPTAQAAILEAQGKTVLFVSQDDRVIGLLAAADTLRPETPFALAEVLKSGIKKLELLTGDNEPAAAAIVESLKRTKSGQALAGIHYRANLLPEDKIAIVKDYQSRGHIVVMVGDGVNDAPALAQADVGIAMGAAGSDIAIEAAHVALMREDWLLIPDLFKIARRTMRVVKLNIGFTAIYNVVGLSLAALGYLPPIFAAAAQSLPDLGILANSSRLLRYKPR